jgi:hypothetical protein
LVLYDVTSGSYEGRTGALLEEERGRKRQALLEATEKGLTKIAQEVARRKKKPLKAAAEVATIPQRINGIRLEGGCNFGLSKFYMQLS